MQVYSGQFQCMLTVLVFSLTVSLLLSSVWMVNYAVTSKHPSKTLCLDCQSLSSFFRLIVTLTNHNICALLVRNAQIKVFIWSLHSFISNHIAPTQLWRLKGRHFFNYFNNILFIHCRLIIYIGNVSLHVPRIF